MRPVRTIGLTGGIASGKSTVARMLAELGAVVIDADEEARLAVLPGEPAWEQIRQTFGSGYFRLDGTLDRRRLAERVFHDSEALRALNAIVHPEVGRRMQAKVLRAQMDGARVVVLDVPLLIEANMQGDVDEVWLVAASEATQLERLVRHKGYPPEEARARIAAQLPLSVKRRYADVVIENDGDEAKLRELVGRRWRERFE